MYYNDEIDHEEFAEKMHDKEVLKEFNRRVATNDLERKDWILKYIDHKFCMKESELRRMFGKVWCLYGNDCYVLLFGILPWMIL